MTLWSIIVVLSIVGVIGIGVYNIISLIRKWKANPGKWIDLLIGIVIWVAALVALIVILYGQFTCPI